MSDSSKSATREKLTWRHVGAVIAAAAMGFVGTSLWLNSSGIFYSSVAQEFNVGLGQVTIYYSLGLFVTIVLLPISGRLLEKGKTRLLYVGSNVLLAIAFFLNAIAPNLWVMYIAGVLASGMCVFDMYLMPVFVAKWFKTKVGTIVGCAGAMSGIGGAIWNMVGSGIILSAGYRMGYMAFGFIVLVVLVPLCIVFAREPKDVGCRPYGEVAAAAAAAESEKKAPVKLTGADYAKVIKSPAFVMFIIMGFCGGLVAMMAQYMTSFALSVGYAATIGAAMTSAAMIGNMLTKIAFGAAADKSPLLSVLGGVVFPLVALAGLIMIGGGSAAVVIALAFIYGGSQPNNVIILPVVTQKTFGDKDYSKIWSTISPFCALASACGATIWGWIYDGMGSFIGVFIVGIILLVVRLIAYLIGRASAKKLPHTEQIILEEAEAANNAMQENE